MVLQTAIPFSGAAPRLACRISGLRLQAVYLFQAFFVSSTCAVSAPSYHSSSIASPPWRRAFAQFAPVVKLWRLVVVAAPNLATGTPHLVNKFC